MRTPAGPTRLLHTGRGKSSTNRKPPEQAAAAFRELPAELPQELAERPQQALRQMTKNPESCQWQPTGEASYAIIQAGPPGQWYWGHGSAESPQPTEWVPEQYLTSREAAQAAAEAGCLTPEQATATPDSEAALTRDSTRHPS